MTKLGPPPPGCFRQGYEVIDESLPAWHYYPMPDDLADVLRRPARSFVPADESVSADITVLLVTSPVPSHPDVWMLKNVYDSVRRQLPSARIVILADGVETVEPKSYVEHKRRIRELGWELVEFKGKHYHTLMLREALLSIVKTPLVMFGENDWGMRDLYIDWKGITETLLDQTSRFKLIQIRQANVAGWEHEFLGKLEAAHGINLLPTILFIDSIHIARFDWYRQIVPFLQHPQNLEGDDLTFFRHAGPAGGNDLVNGLLATKGIEHMACYIPDGPQGRLYHMDGRNIVSPDQLRGIGNL